MMPSLISTSLNVAKVLRSVIQKPLDAGINGNSGRIFLSKQENGLLNRSNRY